MEAKLKMPGKVSYGLGDWSPVSMMPERERVFPVSYFHRNVRGVGSGSDRTDGRIDKVKAFKITHTRD